MESLNRFMSGVSSVTPAGWSLLGGSVAAAAAILCLSLTSHKKEQAELAERALRLIQVDETGKLLGIGNNRLPTTLQQYRNQLAAISAPRPPERTDLFYLTIELDIGMKMSTRSDHYLQENLSTTHEGQQTNLGLMLEVLREVQTTGFAKRVGAAAKSDATLQEKLSPYREEIACGVAALAFYGALAYFVGVKKQLFFEI